MDIGFGVCMFMCCVSVWIVEIKREYITKSALCRAALDLELSHRMEMFLETCLVPCLLPPPAYPMIRTQFLWPPWPHLRFQPPLSLGEGKLRILYLEKHFKNGFIIDRTHKTSSHSLIQRILNRNEIACDGVLANPHGQLENGLTGSTLHVRPEFKTLMHNVLGRVKLSSHELGDVVDRKFIMSFAGDCCEVMLLNSLYVTLVWFVRNIWATQSPGIVLAATKV